jgi:hypothetical protein
LWPRSQNRKKERKKKAFEFVEEVKNDNNLFCVKKRSKKSQNSNKQKKHPQIILVLSVNR